MILNIRIFARATAPLGLILMTLSACSEQVQERPFEIAKKHVWGDKVNGCDYQRIAFYNNSIVKKNSKEMIARIKRIRPSFPIEENEISPYNKIDNNKYNFKVYFVNDIFNDNAVFVYKIKNDTMSLINVDGSDIENIKQNGDVFPTNYTVCK